MVGGVPAVGAHVWGNPRPSCSSAWTRHAVCGHQAYLRLGGLFSDSGSMRRPRRSFTVARPAMDEASTPAAPAGEDAAPVGGLAVADRTDTGRVLDVELRSEVEKSYLSYAMSVIVGRALPDVRDGLKPVHRRILFAMYDLGLMPHKPFRKSARVVGEVLGKYHPHGDTAVYDALVRLAQPFSMRMPLINGHGNFGSQDNDPAAAMRYTECRLQQAATTALLADLEQDAVKFQETFDGSEREPTVLPARLPNLLINGSQGIAVGTATSIPPHNVKEVVAALEALILNPDITVPELMTHLPGPDFPTGGEILASQSMEEAYSTGRGPITVRGRALIEQDSGEGRKKKGSGPPKTVIVITELPYQTNKASLVEDIAMLANEDKVLQGVSDVRDESDREGMRVVVELKKGVAPEVVLNMLYKHTQLQKRFSCNLVAIVGGLPCRLGLKDILAHFLTFRCQVVTRRAKYELRRAERRLHIVTGLASAQQNLDAVVDTIRKASDTATASHMLRGLLDLSPEQADAVLALPLRRLTTMEASKLLHEQAELQEQAAGLRKLLGSQKAIRQVVLDEAHQLTASLGDERRTLVRKDVDGKLQHEDIIPNRQSLIVFSSRGYIKRMAADFFSPQNRGGIGQKVASLKEDDALEELMVVRDHQSLLFFTTDGLAFSIKAYEVPQASRTASGTALPQVLPLSKDQRVVAMLPVTDFAKDGYVMLLSRTGFMKRITLEAFAKRQGTNAMDLVDNDELIWVRKCQPEDDVMLATSDGQVMRYSARMFRPMGRAARGLRAVKLRPGVGIVGMTVLPAQEDTIAEENDTLEGADEEGFDTGAVDPGDGPCILFVTDKGYGKRVPARLFRCLANPRAKGVLGIKVNNDQLGAFHVVTSENEALLSTSNGLITRISLGSVPTQGRQSRGVILMRPKTDQDKISTVTLINADEQAE